MSRKSLIKMFSVVVPEQMTESDLNETLCRISPYLEHEYEICVKFLCRAARSYVSTVLRYACDLRLAGYVFADDLWAELTKWIQNEGIFDEGLQKILDEEFKIASENRMFLFPDLKEED